MPVPDATARAATEVRCTIEPPPFFAINGATALIQISGATTFTLNTSLASDTGVSNNEVNFQIPALLTSTSQRSSPATNAATAASSRTSIAGAAIPFTNVAVSCAAAPFMSTHTTVKPSRANTTEVSRPMPWPAPVTMAMRLSLMGNS